MIKKYKTYDSLLGIKLIMKTNLYVENYKMPHVSNKEDFISIIHIFFKILKLLSSRSL